MRNLLGGGMRSKKRWV